MHNHFCPIRFYTFEMLRLEKPDARHRQTYLETLSEFRAEGQLRALHAEYFHDSPTFAAFITRLLEKAEPKNILDDRVPESVLWLIQDQELIGRVSIRHALNAGLLELGGHVGYEIRPSFRRLGFGTRALALTLPMVKRLGIEQALVTCDADNIGSRKIIEANGGVLENEIAQLGSSVVHRRYWIALWDV
jgi:predicted acetyltransferase